MKVFRLGGIELALDESEEMLTVKAAAALNIPCDDIASFEIMKKAIDARRAKPPRFVYVLKITVSNHVTLPFVVKDGISWQEMDVEQARPQLAPVKYLHDLPISVIGMGPAGLFAAYILALRGLPVLLLERGPSIEKRTKDVQKFWESGVLNPQSNVLFGEGGAGTFSDGKLTSRSKNPYTFWVKKILVDMGAQESILTDAKPHIGTDQLRKVIVNLRKKLMNMGCEIKFEATVTDFLVRQGAIAALIVNEREEIKTSQVILAIGQSADDAYRQLFRRGVQMEAKPFAMGLRVEHPQTLINAIQYGKWAKHPQLPPAEYSLTAPVTALNRSVYTFCMCPGGSVVGCSAFPEGVITNGMSNSQRSGEFANSAIVVNTRIDDFVQDRHPLSGLDFRHFWENKAFELGGADYFAPAQRLTDFLQQKGSKSIGRTSFRPGVKPALLAETLPEFAVNALRIGIRQFDKKMPGFITEEAHLIGVETRTSSPVRISRSKGSQSESIRGIYPCGEGAGFAGGIISSALDGIKAAQHLAEDLN